MENFIVSARKYRPSRFEDVIGQPQVTATLKNAIKTGQIAQAFLFCGPRGVGKTTCARILSKAVNCENISKDSEPCNECDSCLSSNKNQSFNIFELDAASNNSVEDIRNLVDEVRFVPQAGKKKIYIIDEVHMLSASAFNAFLKTLEEPPSYAIFILATTEKHKIIPTILSRCQIFDFNRIRTGDMVQHLQSIAKRENIQAEEEALHLIAQKADGALRDALSMFDRISIFSESKITYQNVLENLNLLDYDLFFKMTDFFLAADIKECLLAFNNVLEKGFEGENLLGGLADHFRNLLVAKDNETIHLMDLSENLKQRHVQQATYTASSFLISALAVFNETEVQYRSSKNKRLIVEMALIKLCHLPNAILLAKEITTGKKKILSNTDASLQVREDKQEFNSPLTESTGSLIPAANAANNEKSNSKLPSLESIRKEILFTKQEEEQQIAEIVYEEIDSYAFRQVWNTYVQKLQREKKTFILKILEVFTPEIIERKKILLLVGNDSHYHALMQEREELYYFLKKELGKKAIDLVIEVDKSKAKNGSENRKPYTAKEKFDHLLQKNPKLQQLKDRMKLELDY